MREFDVAVVGGGPGGYVAAIRCAQLGKRTVLIEKDKLGGTCLNRGCIPTKALVHNAQLIREIRGAKRRGIDVGQPEINMKLTMKMKNRIVSQLNSGVGMLMEKNDITVLSGEAEFVSANTLLVNGEEISCTDLILATGSSNAIPPVPGLDGEDILTSTEILDLDAVPQSLCIIGGGVIGCEFAGIYRAYGASVTIIEMTEHLLPALDHDASQTLEDCFANDGIDVKTSTRVTAVERTQEGYLVHVTLQDGMAECIPVERVLVSTGRRGNTEGLSALGLEMTRGYINVDEQMRTSVAHVYAIGDVTGTIQLAHVASAQGVVAAEAIAGQTAAMDYTAVPSCIYSIPEIASVGLSEQEVQQRGIPYVCGDFPTAACGRAKTMGETVGFTKLLAEAETGRVLGACVVGPNATELIGELAYIVRTGGTLQDITGTIHAHPTIGETIMEAAHVAQGTPISI